MNWRNGDAVEPVPAMALSANYFQLLGVHAWLGRTFTPEDAVPDVVVLSYEFWQRRFASDRGIIGRTVNLNGRPFIVIGVMARGYRAAMGALIPQMFVPVSPAVADGLEDRGRPSFSVVARLAPGMWREQARAAFTARAQALEKAYPTENHSLGEPAFVAPLSGLASLRERNSHPEFLIGLAAPFVVMGLLLAIACANSGGSDAGARRDSAARDCHTAGTGGEPAAIGPHAGGGQLSAVARGRRGRAAVDDLGRAAGVADPDFE